MKTRNRGMGGLIIVILVLGFMMAIASNYQLMLQTETLGQSTSEHFFRARLAALSGVEFVRGQLLATQSTFTPDNYQNRLYFMYASSTTDIQKRLGVSAGNEKFYKGVVSTQWYYPNVVSSVLIDELASSTAFRVTSYFDPDNVATAYYVKSQGTYFDIDPGSNNVTASYSCQIIARLNIATLTQEVRIDLWRPMPMEPAQSNTDAFYASGPTISP